MNGLKRTEIISTLGVTILTSYRWPMGDEGKQAVLQGGVAGPPPYPEVLAKLQGQRKRPREDRA